MNKFESISDLNQGHYALTASDTVNVRVLGAASAETIVIPTDGHVVALTALKDHVFFKFNTAPSVSADTTDGTGAIPIPAGTTRFFNCYGKTNIQVISEAASIVHAEFWKIT